MRDNCVGAGIQVDSTRAYWGNTLCPICHAIANVDEDCRVEPHTVLVIGWDEEE